VVGIAVIEEANGHLCREMVGSLARSNQQDQEEDEDSDGIQEDEDKVDWQIREPARIETFDREITHKIKLLSHLLANVPGNKKEKKKRMRSRTTTARHENRTL
jgi:hypothetical protein